MAAHVPWEGRLTADASRQGQGTRAHKFGIMPMYKRSRGRRQRRTRRRTRRLRKPNLTRSIKAVMNTQIYKALESKCVTSNLLGLNNVTETIPSFVSQVLYQAVTPGVTDRGRTGNTIHATGVRVHYVYKYQFPNSGDLYSTEPMTLHMFIIKVKNPWVLPHTHWFKSLDRGAETPTVLLDRESIDDGRRVLNTDQFDVISHKTVTLQPTEEKPVVQHTGHFSVSLKRSKITYGSNSTFINGIGDLDKVYMFYAYVYTGSGIDVLPPVNYGVRFGIYQYYKD